MKINIGIVGYGNLGKAVEKILISDPNFNLVAIFSRRMIKSKFNTLVENYNAFLDYKNKIDIMLLCGGSKNDLEPQSEELIKHYDIINTFDNHPKIKNHLDSLNNLAQNSKHVAIACAGWDPGIFSIIRTLFYSISKQLPHTFWGKGISMGHSDAIRQVAHVDDGLEFTIPIDESIKKAKQNLLSESDLKHERICFVSADEKHHKRIEEDIKNIPNYFKGQPTTVNFVSINKIFKLKQNIKHRGIIIDNFFTKNNTSAKLEFSVYMKSNPDFTATIMTMYVYAIKHLQQDNQFGAFTPIDIPIKYLLKEADYNKIFDKIC